MANPITHSYEHKWDRVQSNGTYLHENTDILQNCLSNKTLLKRFI